MTMLETQMKCLLTAQTILKQLVNYSDNSVKKAQTKHTFLSLKYANCYRIKVEIYIIVNQVDGIIIE